MALIQPAGISKPPASSSPTAAPRTSKPKTSRPRKPNYNYIHRNLLPIEIHTLPVLIPHNPLSILAVALSYLAQLLKQPPQPRYNAYFSSATSSVHVTDPTAMRKLWEMGFFGKGSLSRSEPTWLQSQKKQGATSEENTSQRRTERRQQKLERARKEQEIIAKRKSETETNGTITLQPLKTNSTNIDAIASVLEPTPETTPPDPPDSPTNGTIHGYEEWKKAIDANGIPTPPATSVCSETSHANGHPVMKLQRTKTVRFSPTIEAREFDLSSPVISPIKTPGPSPLAEPTSHQRQPPTTQEHLQLSLEEAFFLSYALGILDIFSEDSNVILPPSSLLSLFRRHSYSPPHTLSNPDSPDDSFMISYAAYHHYRSLGWVVRSGVKFAVDYLLYNRGPAFTHAEFSVVLIPSYTHAYWRESDERRKYTQSQEKRSWWWLHAVNRVQAQVMKTLVFCYVDVPPPLDDSEKGDQVDIAKLLSRYRVRDVCIRRWTPNRTRD